MIHGLSSTSGAESISATGLGDRESGGVCDLQPLGLSFLQRDLISGSQSTSTRPVISLREAAFGTVTWEDDVGLTLTIDRNHQAQGWLRVSVDIGRHSCVLAADTYGSTTRWR